MNRIPPLLKSATRLLAALVSLQAVASVGAEEFTHSTMRFDRLGIEQGLSQSAVMDVAQDASGFLWFATESGLDRYDGYGFRRYRHERGNDRSLSNNFVRDLAVDDSGALWAATDGGGISRWDPESDSFSSWRHNADDANSIASDRIRRVMVGASGDVWIATRESGLDRLQVESGTITHYRHDPHNDNSLSSDEIYAIALGDRGEVWVGTRRGLNRLDPGSGAVERFEKTSKTFGAFADAHIRSLFVNQAGDLWIGTNDDGLHLHVPGRRAAVTYRHDADDDRSISSNRIETLFEDASGRLWVGTDNGLSMFDRQSRRFRRHKSIANDLTSLSDNYIFSIFQDRGGILWVGTRSGGANKWNPRSWLFGHVRPQNDAADSLSNPHVTSFAMDRMGRSWIGTFGGGINVFASDQSTMETIRKGSNGEQSLSDDRVMTLLQTKDGSIWAGTMRGGLNRIDPETFAVTTYRHAQDDPNSLAADGVMTLFEDRAGRLWVGTFGGGLSRFRPATGDFVSFRSSADPTSLSSNRATSIVQDADGAIWVGTDGGGLNRSNDDGQSWQRFEHSNDEPQSLSANTIYSLHTTGDRTVWVGTRNGLDRVYLPDNDSERPIVENTNDRYQIDGRNIYSLTRDSDGRLWMGTERGLISLDTMSGVTREYHSEHGLQGDEFNFGAAYYSPTGELFFGGSNGFNRFDPRNLVSEPRAAPIRLTSFEIWNERVSPGTPLEKFEAIELGYDDDSVSFEFAVLDFESPERNQYSHQLVGFDEGWVESGTNRRVYYTNLDGGEYELRVRATHADRQWSGEEFSLPIRVAHAPWETWWAYTLYVLLLFGVMYSVYTQQNRKLKREARLSRRLEREVEIRTEELSERNKDLSDVNKRLEELSTTDPLTGMRNRRYLFENVAKDADLVLRRQKNQNQGRHSPDNSDLVFLMVDLDDFKRINDEQGHRAGDELLLKISDVLVECCRTSDEIVRWGGDEFLIIARDANHLYAANLAERIRTNIAQREFVVAGDRVVQSTASIGYACYPFFVDRPDLVIWEDVLGFADTAMYQAKKSRNAWIGIDGVRWNGDGETLYKHVKEDVDDLVAKGFLRWITSIKSAAVSNA